MVKLTVPIKRIVVKTLLVQVDCEYIYSFIGRSFQADIKPSFDGYAFHKLSLFLKGGKWMNFSAIFP